MKALSRVFTNCLEEVFSETRLLNERLRWRTPTGAKRRAAGVGDHDLFLFATSVKGTVEGLPSLAHCECHRGGNYGGTGAEGDFCTGAPSSERVPFDAHLGFPAAFVDLTVRADNAGREVGYPYRRATDLLSNCPTADHGRE